MEDENGSSLPPDGSGDAPADPWPLPEPVPTTLIALWPHDEAPTETEILALVAQFAGSAAGTAGEVEADDVAVLWSALIQLPGLPHPVILWSEPARPIPPQELDDPRAEACRWIVGAETLLDADDPLTSFASLMRTLAGSLEEAPAILDVCSTRWHPREALDEILAGDVEPPEHMLWIVHAVAATGASESEPCWLHTHGLWRCGRPELEMLEVPRRHIGSAGELLNAVAGRILEEPAPLPGEPFAIGHELEVSLQPWEDVARYLADDVPGSLEDRDDGEDEHRGVRAAVCGARPTGTFRRIWSWPQEVIVRLDRDDAVLYLTLRSTERLARHARATWPQLAMTFATLPPPLIRLDARPDGTSDAPSVRFIMKAGFPVDDGSDAGREHLWFIVRRFDGDRAQAELINEPMEVPQLARGDVTWIERSAISDWSVITPLGSFGPSRIKALQQAIDRLRQGDSP